MQLAVLAAFINAMLVMLAIIHDVSSMFRGLSDASLTGLCIRVVQAVLKRSASIRPGDAVQLEVQAAQPCRASCDVGSALSSHSVRSCTCRIVCLVCLLYLKLYGNPQFCSVSSVYSCRRLCQDLNSALSSHSVRGPRSNITFILSCQLSALSLRYAVGLWQPWMLFASTCVLLVLSLPSQLRYWRHPLQPLSETVCFQAIHFSGVAKRSSCYAFNDKATMLALRITGQAALSQDKDPHLYSGGFESHAPACASPGQFCSLLQGFSRRAGLDRASEHGGVTPEPTCHFDRACPGKHAQSTRKA